MLFNLKGVSVVLGLTWLTAMIILFNIPRSDFSMVWSLYSIAFISYLFLVFKIKIDLYTGLILALVIRIISFGFTPHLTDDYFRFIWDGMIMHQGINPVAYLPSFLLHHPEIAMTDANLFSHLNSPDYYSVYPPVAQLLFYFSFAINDLDIEGHIIFYKAVLLIADVAVVYTLYLLLKKNNLPPQRALIYALNPMIIIEFMGNLHFEGLMIACLLAAILYSGSRSVMLSSLFMTASIGVKLIPVMLLPFMPREMYWKKIITWGITTIILTSFMFWLFLRVPSGWLQSIALWFRSFEFNAGIYYLLRELDALWRGYENIQFIGPLMAAISFTMIAITWIYYRKKHNMHWSAAMLYVLTIYFLMTTTLHPWYLGTVLALSVISGHYYPIIWTYVVFLSYSHYANGGFSEKYIFIWIEYVILFVWMYVEFFFPLKPKPKRGTVFFPPAS